MQSPRTLGWTTACLLSVATPAAAGSWETLVMPGQVAEPHAKFEKECSRCHRPFRKAMQGELCLECHEETRRDLDTRTRFHGTAPNVANAECSTCHPDHQGRDADIVRLDPHSFDHSLTQFALLGAHAKTACESCHPPERRRRETSHRCRDCHGRNDPHRGRLGAKCASCHVPNGWRNARFDHGGTHFPLRGRHASVSCESCHPNQRFTSTPTDCYACHALEDAHAGRFGRDCTTCHDPRRWNPSTFDHGRKTRFALTGSHRNAACGACHRGDLYADKLPRDCLSCHRIQDEHKGRFGTDCGSCHTPRAWAIARFDHEKRTRFALQGRHGKIACEACHKVAPEKVKPGSDCYACHADHDVHRRQEGERCDLCHGQSSWAHQVRFDHGLARFPLLGLHSIVPCEECHATPAFQDASSLCDDCHHRNDDHDGRLGSDCALCHNPNGWKFSRFDHDVQTRFPLEKAHTGLACFACHTRAVRGRPTRSRLCGSCHAADDVHLGQFGPRCDRCHDGSSFAEVTAGR